MQESCTAVTCRITDSGLAKDCPGVRRHQGPVCLQLVGVLWVVGRPSELVFMNKEGVVLRRHLRKRRSAPIHDLSRTAENLGSQTVVTLRLRSRRFRLSVNRRRSICSGIQNCPCFCVGFP